MIVGGAQIPFLGYIEGKDVSTLSSQNLTFPSRNVIVHKGKVLKRLGIDFYGQEGQTTDIVHSEFPWKDAKSGKQYLRMWKRNLELHYEHPTEKDIQRIWIRLATDFFDPAVERVDADTWTDSNGSIIKKRMFMVDGSINVYEWNGAVAVVQDATDPASIVISGTKTLLQLGFDPGPQDVLFVHFAADGSVAAIESAQYDDDGTDTDVDFPTPLSFDISPGDLIIAKPITHTTVLPNFKKDIAYTYKNHFCLAALDDTVVYGSHVVNKLDFVLITPTAATPFLLTLDGLITAMISRKDILWISTEDDWFKIRKLDEPNAFGEFVEVEKEEQSERKGALPYAVAIQKGDIVFFSQDRQLMNITDIEVINSSQFKLISDDVENLFLRLNPVGVRIYYLERSIILIFPAESVMVMLDTVAEYFQPPQVLPITCMTVIGNRKIVHSNAKSESYELFATRNDLGAEVVGIIAGGFLSKENPLFTMAKHTMMGLNGRLNRSTKVNVVEYFEYDGSNGKHEFDFDGGEIKTYAIPDDVSWATWPWASRSWAGDDLAETNEDTALRRFYIYDKWTATDYKEIRPVITITGVDSEFHLIAWATDEQASTHQLDPALFIRK